MLVLLLLKMLLMADAAAAQAIDEGVSSNLQLRHLILNQIESTACDAIVAVVVCCSKWCSKQQGGRRGGEQGGRRGKRFGGVKEGGGGKG